MIQGGAFANVRCSWVVFIDFKTPIAAVVRSLRQASHIAEESKCDLIISERREHPASAEALVVAAFYESISVTPQSATHTIYIHTNAHIISDPLPHFQELSANTGMAHLLSSNESKHDSPPLYEICTVVLPLFYLFRYFASSGRQLPANAALPTLAALIEGLAMLDNGGFKIQPVPVPLRQSVWRQNAAYPISILHVGSGGGSTVDLYPSTQSDPYLLYSNEVTELHYGYEYTVLMPKKTSVNVDMSKVLDDGKTYSGMHKSVLGFELVQLPSREVSLREYVTTLLGSVLPQVSYIIRHSLLYFLV